MFPVNSFANPGRGLKSKNINRKQHRTAKMVSGAKKEADSDYLRQELSREKVRKEEFDIEDLHRDLEKKLEEQGFVFDKRKFLISEASATFLERLTDNVVKFVGSWAFIAAFLAFIGLWISLNFWIIYNNAFDPFPFILLNLILSCVAAIQAPMILMSQNRQAQRDRKQEEINIEKEILDFKQDRLDLIIDEKQWAMLKEMHSKIKKIEEQLSNKKSRAKGKKGKLR